MIGYAPFLGQVVLRPVLGQDALPLGLSLTYAEVSNVKYGLDRAMKAILANPTARCVVSVNRGQLDHIRTMLLEILDGGRDGIYTLRPDQLDVIQQVLSCGDELTGGAIARQPSEGPSLLPLAIPALVIAASVGVSGYHGYKRNNSTGWAFWWGFMGLMFPVLTPVVAIAQGYGKREK